MDILLKFATTVGLLLIGAGLINYWIPCFFKEARDRQADPSYRAKAAFLLGVMALIFTLVAGLLREMWVVQ